MGPVPDSTTFVDVNLSCFAASIVLYAPSTYEAVAATDVLSISPSAKAGEITDNTAKMQNNFFIFVFLLGLANFVTYYERNQPALTLGFYYWFTKLFGASTETVVAVVLPHSAITGTVEALIVANTPVFVA